MAYSGTGCDTFTPEDQRRFDERLTPESREVVKRLVQKALDVMKFNAERMSRNRALERGNEFESDTDKRKREISEKEEQKQKLLEKEWYDACVRRRAFAKYKSEKGK